MFSFENIRLQHSLLLFLSARSLHVHRGHFAYSNIAAIMRTEPKLTKFQAPIYFYDELQNSYSRALVLFGKVLYISYPYYWILFVSPCICAINGITVVLAVINFVRTLSSPVPLTMYYIVKFEKALTLLPITS